MFTPKVSIVIPVYNGENFVQEAIDSALNQTYKNIEVVVVNDGSKDHTDEILKSYGNKIKYFSKENGGVASALNFAIKKASGEYISWLSHDDLYSEDKIEKQVEKLNSLTDKKSIIFSNFSIFNNDNKEERFINLEENGYQNGNKKSILTLLFASGLHGCTLLIPKTAFEKCGYFDEKLKTTQDYDLWFKFIKKGYKFYLVKDYLVKGRLHDRQDSKTKQVVCTNEQQVLFLNAAKMFFKDILFMDKDSFLTVKQTLNRLKLRKYYKILKIIRILTGRL